MSESKWIDTQRKTFTKWVNSQVVKRWGQSAVIIKDFATSWQDGILLMQLVHALYAIPMPKYNPKPKARVHQIDNINLALDMLEKHAQVKTNFLKVYYYFSFPKFPNFLPLC